MKDLGYLTRCCFFVVLLATSSLDAQEREPEARFYYVFDKKVAGQLDTSVLALDLPAEAQRGIAIEILALDAAPTTLEDAPYAEAFRQEGIIFMQLHERLTAERFLRLATRLRAAEPAARLGHPFFIEGDDVPLILTDEFIVRFKEGTTQAQHDELQRNHAVELLEQNPHVEGQFLFRVTPETGDYSLETANRYQESGLTVFAQPNFLVHVEYNHTPTDTNYPKQWHLHNTGSGGMTTDADIDAEEAWDLTRGDPNVVVAVLDGGFEITHPDLQSNILVNPIERNGSIGVDDDSNGYVDDVNGWNFYNNSDRLNEGGDSPRHGQAVAGLVAGEENSAGVVGVCPRCRILLIVNNFDINDLANAFYYARDRGADIITNSWGRTGTKYEQPALVQALADTANGTRGALGTAIFFASGNGGVSEVAYPARDPNTIAIGGSDCADAWVTYSQYDQGLSVVSPTRTRLNDGSCGLVTTGLGNTVINDFDGTSGATPIAAGIAGLLLSAKPDLTREEIQRLLQDTADKIQDSLAQYDPATGFSQSQRHAFGRVNAFEAVRVVAPRAAGGLGGRGGVDVFVRDHRLDWGNTEQPSSTLFEPTRGYIPPWISVDIKIDAGPVFAPSEPATAQEFEDLPNENPRTGEINRVYVRVRNRGPDPDQNVRVQLYWAYAGTALPPLPANFWTVFPGPVSGPWNSTPCASGGLSCTIPQLEYSGASAVRDGPDAARIVRFDLLGPPPGSGPEPDHFCMIAIADSDRDPVGPRDRPIVQEDFIVGSLVVRDNNVAWRNFKIQDRPEDCRHFRDVVFVRNPTLEPAQLLFRLDAPEGWRLESDAFELGEPFDVEPGFERPATLELFGREDCGPSDVHVIQETRTAAGLFRGGMTYSFRPPPETEDRRTRLRIYGVLLDSTREFKLEVDGAALGFFSGLGLGIERHVTSRLAVELSVQSLRGNLETLVLDGDMLATARSEVGMLTFQAGFNYYLGSPRGGFFLGPFLSYVDYPSSPSVTLRGDPNFGLGLILGYNTTLGASRWQWYSSLRYLDAAIEIESARGRSKADFDPLMLSVGVGYRF